MDLPATAPALLLVISGPAGSGKSTLCERMVRQCPGMERVVTSTTRPPRAGEVDKKDYFFFSNEEFDQLVQENAFLEWARVHTNRYGTLRRVIEEKLSSNVDLCLNLDVQGVGSLKRAAAQDPLLAQRLVTVFLIPKNFAELQKRLISRGQDDAAEIERRLVTAKAEVKHSKEYDFCITSGSKEEDFAALRKIWEQEKKRTSRLG